MKCVYLTVLLTMILTGCVTREAEKRTRLPLRTGTKIRFDGIKDGKCEIGDVFVDVNGWYTVKCKK